MDIEANRRPIGFKKSGDLSSFTFRGKLKGAIGGFSHNEAGMSLAFRQPLRIHTNDDKMFQSPSQGRALQRPQTCVLHTKHNMKNFAGGGKKPLAMGIVLMYIPFHR
jgi:hypothetical protein